MSARAAAIAHALARPLATAATCAAALGVPLLFVRSLEAPFVVPKLALAELAATAGFLAVGLRLLGGGRVLARPVVAGVVLVLLTTALAGLVASTGPAGAPYAGAALARWLTLFGLAGGAAVVAGDARGRRLLPETVVAAAAAVSAIGLWQHLDLSLLPIPVISAPGATFGNRNLAAELVAMSLPFALALLVRTRREVGPPAATAALLAVLVLQVAYLGATRARGAWLGALAGVVAFLLLVRPRISRPVALVGLVGALVAAVAAIVPGASNPRFGEDDKRFGSPLEVVRASFDPESVAVRSRLGMWKRTLAMWREHPLWGVGPGNWPVFFPQHAEPGATEDHVLSPQLAPRQVHNDLLERASETGLAGLAALLVLAAGVVVATRRRLRAEGRGERGAIGEGAPDADGRDARRVAGAGAGRSGREVTAAGAGAGRGGREVTAAAGTGRGGREVTAAAAGALVALMGAGFTGFPLEMPGTLVLAGLALGLVGAHTPDLDSGWAPEGRSAVGSSGRASSAMSPSPLAPAVLVLGVLLVPWVLLRADRQLRGSYWLGQAERALRRGTPEEAAREALPHLERARAAAPRHFRTDLRLALVLIRLDRPAEGSAAARRALALEPWSPNAWTVLSAAQLAEGDPAAARASATRALTLLADYPQALALAARAAEATGDPATASAAWRRLHALTDPAAAGKDTAESARELLREHDRLPASERGTPEAPAPAP